MSRVELVGSLVVGVALGSATTAIVGGDSPAPHVATAPVAVPRVKFDPSPHQKALDDARAAQPNAMITDLMSEGDVAPGQRTTSGANFPLGSRLWSVERPILTGMDGQLLRPGTVELTGAAKWAFLIDAVTCRVNGDATWCEVTATSISKTRQRFTALVEVVKS